MKIGFRRAEHILGSKIVKLYVGGEFVCQIGEQSLNCTDWKNASEAKHACREELKKWMNEKPPKPEALNKGQLLVIFEGKTKGNWVEDRLTSVAEAVEQRTREIVAWEQEHGE